MPAAWLRCLAKPRVGRDSECGATAPAAPCASPRPRSAPVARRPSRPETWDLTRFCSNRQEIQFRGRGSLTHSACAERGVDLMRAYARARVKGHVWMANLITP